MRRVKRPSALMRGTFILQVLNQACHGVGACPETFCLCLLVGCSQAVAEGCADSAHGKVDVVGKFVHHDALGGIALLEVRYAHKVLFANGHDGDGGCSSVASSALVPVGLRPPYFHHAAFGQVGDVFLVADYTDAEMMAQHLFSCFGYAEQHVVGDVSCLQQGGVGNGSGRYDGQPVGACVLLIPRVEWGLAACKPLG